MKQLRFPADCPDEVILQKGLERLRDDLDKSILKKTGAYLKIAGLSIGLLLVSAYLDTVLGPLGRSGFLAAFLLGLAMKATEAISLCTLTVCLTKAFISGRTLQKKFDREMEIFDVTRALKVLGAVRCDVDPEPSEQVEPKEIVKAEVAPRLEKTVVRMCPQPRVPSQPSLAESCVAAPAEKRCIALG
jgi:hypothetical protein